MFSKRTDWRRGLNPTALLLEEKKAAGQTVLDLTESNPTQVGLDYPDQEILAALARAENLHYQPSAAGLLSARQAVCDYYGRKNVCVRPDQIFLCSSTSEGYSFLFRLLADPGDTVLFPRPSYPLFQFLVDLNDVEAVFYSLRYGLGWRVDERSLMSAARDNVRALVVVNPNNPTGSCLDRTDRDLLRRFARERSCALISDEVFWDYPFDRQTEALSLVGDSDQLTFVLGGLSKSLALPQMKLSWIVVSGPEDLAQEARARLEVIADTFLSVNTPVQNALPSLLKLQPAIQEKIQARVLQNRAQVDDILSGHPGWRMLAAEGGWYAVLQLPDSLDEERVTLTVLRDDHVWIHPGYFFDFETQPFLVLSLLTPPGNLAEGLRRILKRLG